MPKVVVTVFIDVFRVISSPLVSPNWKVFFENSAFAPASEAALSPVPL